MRTCSLNKCDGSGLIPFRNKNGLLIKNCWVDCECNQDEPDHYHMVSPEDIDYPISYDYYRSLCQHHGWGDLDNCEPPEPIREAPQLNLKALSAIEWDDFQQTKGRLLHLENKMTEMRAKKLKPAHLYTTIEEGGETQIS